MQGTMHPTSLPGSALAQNGTATANGSSEAEAGEQLVEELQNVVVGLRRTGRLAEALTAARDAAADQAKQAIRCEGHVEQDLVAGLQNNPVV